MVKKTAQLLLFGAVAVSYATPFPAQAQTVPLPMDGSVLPYPPPPFAGVVAPAAADSTPSFPPPVRAPAGAPNILLVMTDDVGFGASSTFGGPVPTPNLDRLAAMGVRYNRFNTAAMCSPTRAALLTGRNPHSVGFGTIVDLPSGYPGYSAILPKSAATIAEILKDNGYNTAFFGKHHNVPKDEESPVGPFDHWPTGMGFEYFYGFVGGAMNQFDPRLYRNSTPVDLSSRPADYVLDRDLVDDAIHWVHVQKASAPDKPFFLYLAPGSAHSPHQAPADWIAKFHGRFDSGWDALRNDTYKRQLSMGVIPSGTALTPRPAELPAWNTRNAAQRKVDARMMEVYAAQLAYEDDQFGRLLSELERMGQIDNTLVIFIEGDNGSTAEGGLNGELNEAASMANGVKETTDQQLARINEMGGPNTMELFPAPWGWALNSPFQWTKQVASHLGGTRNGMVVAWPGHIPSGGGIRPQYGFVTDIMPTILEAAHIPVPEIVNGAEQQRVDGISLVYSFNNPGAPSRRTEQIYEMYGNRGIYKDGWLANTTPRRVPWDYTAIPAGSPATSYQWELYNLSKDFSQSDNLASAYPAKLAELRQLWTEEAKTGQIFPLNDSFVGRNTASAADIKATRTHFTYWGPDISVTQGVAPRLFGKSFEITADIETEPGKQNGVIAATGSRFGGWSFYLRNGRPTVYHALAETPEDQTRIEADKPIPTGPTKLSFRFTYDGGGIGKGGTMDVLVDGALVASVHISKEVTLPAGFGESFDTGRDTGAPVSPDYAHEGVFQGRIHRIDVDLLPTKPAN